MKQYIKSIDSLRVLSILAVLATHITTRTLEATKFNLLGFPVSIFINQIVRFAVPLFLMISGFVLELNAGRKFDLVFYFKRRFSRIVIPFIFWSLFYVFFIYTNNHENFLNILLKGDASYQLYFIPTLCIFYIIFPLLHKLYKYLTAPLSLIILFILQFYLLYQDYFIKTYRFADPIRITCLTYFFFIIGIAAAHNINKINNFVHRWKYLLIPASVIVGIYVFWEGFSGFLKTGNYLWYYETWRPSVLIYSILISLVLFHLFEKTKLQFKLIQKLSNLSFFVFFVHVAILEIVWTYIGKSLFGILSFNFLAKALFDPIFFGIVTLFSFSMAFIAHKIPKLYHITG